MGGGAPPALLVLAALANVRSSFISLCATLSVYISRHHFSQLFRTLLEIIWKKIFVTNYPFLTDSLKPPHL